MIFKLFPAVAVVVLSTIVAISMHECSYAAFMASLSFWYFLESGGSFFIIASNFCTLKLVKPSNGFGNLQSADYGRRVAGSERRAPGRSRRRNIFPSGGAD